MDSSIALYRRLNHFLVVIQLLSSYGYRFHFVSLFLFSGNVYEFEYHQGQEETLKTNQRKEIAGDLTNAFSQAASDALEMKTKDAGGKTLRVRKQITEDEIKDVYVFTWLKMGQSPSSVSYNFFLKPR